MALAARGNIIDLVAQIEVLSQDNGCLLDLSAILDVSVCPTIDLHLPKPHSWEAHGDDYVQITPTTYKDVEARSYAPQKYCPNKQVDIDLLNLVHLGLIVKADLDIYLNLLNLIKAQIDLDIVLGIDLLGLGINIGGKKVKSCTKHFKPHCHKKIPDNTKGCKKVTAHNSDDCLARCHAYAAGLTLAAGASASNLAKIVDCTAISFNSGLTVDNCLVATVDVLGILIDAEVDTLIRI